MFDTEIKEEIYLAMKNLGAKHDLLGIVGSWGDSLSDEDVLSSLRAWNVATATELQQNPPIHPGDTDLSRARRELISEFPLEGVRTIITDLKSFLKVLDNISEGVEADTLNVFLNPRDYAKTRFITSADWIKESQRGELLLGLMGTYKGLAIRMGRYVPLHNFFVLDNYMPPSIKMVGTFDWEK